MFTHGENHGFIHNKHAHRRESNLRTREAVQEYIRLKQNK